MKILCSFPGRHGDLLWALPTIRAISIANGVPVDLCIGGEFAGLVPLLQQQSYIQHAWSDPAWHLHPPDEWRAPYAGNRVIAGSADSYDRILHLGHRRWPDQSLPHRLYTQFHEEYPTELIAPLDLDTPWIRVDPYSSGDIAVCFSEEWIELKMGVVLALLEALPHLTFSLVGPLKLGRRGEWARAWSHAPNARVFQVDWIEAAGLLRGSRAVLTCNSGLWVLANAVNRPVIMLEPSEARHNPIFWLPHARNHWVVGGDGKPTVDARHCAETIERVLHAQ